MGVFARKDSCYWWISYKNATGKRVRESTEVERNGKDSKELAKRICNEKEQDVWRQKHLKEKPKKLWEEAVLEYLKRTKLKSKTKTNLLSILRWLDKYLSNRPLQYITKQYIEEIALAKEAEGCGAATINKVLNTIKAILRKACYEWEWIDKVPYIRLRKEPPPRMRWESPETIARVLLRCPEHQRKPILFALCTGLRKTNVAQHEKAWIARELAISTIPGEYYKNGKPHTVCLNTLAMQIVNEEWDKHEKYLFTYEGKPIKELNTKAWRNALKAEGVMDFTWHDLRHTWASWMAQNGEQLLTIMQAGGWSDVRMVKRYAHLSPDYLANSAEKLHDTKLKNFLVNGTILDNEKSVTKT